MALSSPRLRLWWWYALFFVFVPELAKKSHQLPLEQALAGAPICKKTMTVYKRSGTSANGLRAEAKAAGIGARAAGTGATAAGAGTLAVCTGVNAATVAGGDTRP